MLIVQTLKLLSYENENEFLAFGSCDLLCY